VTIAAAPDSLLLKPLQIIADAYSEASPYVTVRSWRYLKACAAFLYASFMSSEEVHRTDI
jgi:hypothetical protein